MIQQIVTILNKIIGILGTILFILACLIWLEGDTINAICIILMAMYCELSISNTN